MGVLFAKGNRLFSAAWLLFILAAIGHTTAALPDEPAVSAAVDAMEHAVFATGTALEFSLWEVYRGAWIQVGALMLAIALLNLTMLAASGGALPLRRALLVVDLVTFVPLTLVFTIVLIPPPLITFGVMSMLLAIDLVRSFARAADGAGQIA